MTASATKQLHVNLFSQQDTLPKIHQIAGNHQGKCFNKEFSYKNNFTLRLICKNSHLWEAMADKILQGRWCPICAHFDLYLPELKKMAKERGGRCLSKDYKDTKKPLQWKCKRGHIWWARPHNIKTQSWCPTCSRRLGHMKLRLPFEKIQKMAAKLGGQCLSKNYPNYRVKLTWQCGQGHKWKAPARSVLVGHWCPKCAGRKQTILDMKALASQRGGKCLSRKFQGVRTKLKWQCQRKHEWWQAPFRIKSGLWCRRCASIETANKTRLSIEEMKAMAEKHHGKCLSEKYIRSNSPLLWECFAKHQWWAPASRIKFGRWCKKCFFIHHSARLKCKNSQT